MRGRSVELGKASMAAAALRRCRSRWRRYTAPQLDSFYGKVADGEANLPSYPSVLEVAGDGEDSSVTVKLGFGFRAG